jgi:glycosyltransferase involved in cell wall biosynthesis
MHYCNEEMKKIILLTNILAPYRIPLYNLLGEKFKREGYKLKIAFMAEIEENRAWQIRRSELQTEAIVLPGWHKFFWRSEFPFHLNWGVWKFLKRENPDVVISGGYSEPANWVALAYCKHFAKPLILWTSVTKESVKGRDILRRTLRSFFIRLSDAFVTYGKKATEYLLEFGIAPEAVFTGCNLGDVEFYREATLKFRKTAEFVELRSSLKKPVLLYVGQFIHRKGILQLLDALSGLKNERWSLLLVGDGPLQGEIKKRIEAQGLSDRVVLTGFKEKEELAKFYSVSDIFVLPSLREPYAIVISEALASGVFVVASRYDGAAWDLIEEERNGIIVDPTDAIGLREGIRKALKIVQNPAFNREAITQSIANFGLDRYAQAFINAALYVAEKKRV